jgi:hypothetical protein
MTLKVHWDAAVEQIGRMCVEAKEVLLPLCLFRWTGCTRVRWATWRPPSKRWQMHASETPSPQKRRAAPHTP